MQAIQSSLSSSSLATSNIPEETGIITQLKKELEDKEKLSLR